MSKKEKLFPLNTVGGRIQKLRHEMNLSRPDLYNSVYKNETSEFLSDSSKEKTVYNWESGRTELNYSTLCTLCKILQCSSDYLLGLEECSNKNAQFIYHETGLSEDSQKKLQEIIKTPQDGKEMIAILDKLIQNPAFSIFLIKDINRCYSKFDDLKWAENSPLSKIIKREYSINEEIESKKSGVSLYNRYRQRMSDCHDSYDASLFRIQGDFGKLIDDLIQKCYYENNPYDE